MYAEEKHANSTSPMRSPPRKRSSSPSVKSDMDQRAKIHAGHPLNALVVPTGRPVSHLQANPSMPLISPYRIFDPALYDGAFARQSLVNSEVSRLGASPASSSSAPSAIESLSSQTIPRLLYPAFPSNPALLMGDRAPNASAYPISYFPMLADVHGQTAGLFPQQLGQPLPGQWLDNPYLKNSFSDTGNDITTNKEASRSLPKTAAPPGLGYPNYANDTADFMLKFPEALAAEALKQESALASRSMSPQRSTSPEIKKPSIPTHHLQYAPSVLNPPSLSKSPASDWKISYTTSRLSKPDTRQAGLDSRQSSILRRDIAYGDNQESHVKTEEAKQKLVSLTQSFSDGIQASATNGNALGIDGNNSGPMAGRDIIQHYTTNMNYSMDQSETITPEKSSKLVEDFIEKLEKQSPIFENYGESNEENHIKLQIFHGNMQHWNYCEFESDRNMVSAEITSLSTNSVVMEEILNLENNKVVIVGPANVGKTTFVKSSGEKYRNSNCKHIFYIDLKSLPHGKDIDCLRFLTSDRTLTKDMSNTKSCQEILDRILNIEDKLLLILDHVDFLNINSKNLNQKRDDPNYYPDVACFDISTPKSFVINIIRGNIFGKAKKLFITRPCNVEWMHAVTQFKPKIFNISGRNKLFLDKNVEKLPNVKKELVQENSVFCENIWSSCFVPCISLMFLDGLDLFELPATLTFAYAFLQFFASVVEESNFALIEDLVNIVWDYFYKEDKFCIEMNSKKLKPELIETMFITVPIKRKFGRFIYKSHLLHIMFHEFLIALKAISLNESDFINFIDNSMKDKQFCFVNKFICGLCRENISCVLECLPLDCLKDKFFVNIDANKRSLLQKLECLAKEDNLDESLVTQYCEYLCEINDDETTRCIAQCLDFNRVVKNKFVLYVLNFLPNKNGFNGH